MEDPLVRLCRATSDQGGMEQEREGLRRCRDQGVQVIQCPEVKGIQGSKVQ